MLNKHLEKKITEQKKLSDPFTKLMMLNDPFEDSSFDSDPLFKSTSISSQGQNSFGKVNPKPTTMINNLFESHSILGKAPMPQNEPPIFGKPHNNSFIDALKSITQNWQDSYKQKSLAEYANKNEKAPPPADMFASIPTTTNFQIGIPLFANILPSLQKFHQ